MALSPILAFHVAAGGIALASGYAALFVRKGSRLHRGSGTVFFLAMIAMATAALAIALGRGVAPAINVPAALLVIYLVLTARDAARTPPAGRRHAALVTAFLGAGTAVIVLAFGIAAQTAGQLAVPQFLFAAVAAAGAAGDIRILRQGIRSPAHRIVRHLWRMCAALLVAALSFFIGQADVLPESLRIYPLLAVPLLVIPGVMTYWLRKVRSKGIPTRPAAT